jgi:hypothetical protein
MVPKDAGRRTKTHAPLEIFCSYAHEDELFRQQLERHLSLLLRQDVATLWHYRRIAAGANWSEAVDAHLEKASLVLLLSILINTNKTN